MGIEDMVDKAKDVLTGNSEAVDDAIDKTADAVKDVAPDAVDPTVDKVADAAKDVI